MSEHRWPLPSPPQPSLWPHLLHALSPQHPAHLIPPLKTEHNGGQRVKWNWPLHLPAPQAWLQSCFEQDSSSVLPSKCFQCPRYSLVSPSTTFTSSRNFPWHRTHTAVTTCLLWTHREPELTLSECYLLDVSGFPLPGLTGLSSLTAALLGQSSLVKVTSISFRRKL